MIIESTVLPLCSQRTLGVRFPTVTAGAVLLLQLCTCVYAVFLKVHESAGLDLHGASAAHQQSEHALLGCLVPMEKLLIAPKRNLVPSHILKVNL